MSLSMTPRMLEAAYEYLRTTPPFRGWGLPDGDMVEFWVSRSLSHYGLYEWTGDTHRIRISNRIANSTPRLIVTMAHEMIHEKQMIMVNGVDHGVWFQRMADRVCKIHGFDRETF